MGAEPVGNPWTVRQPYALLGAKNKEWRTNGARRIRVPLTGGRL
jgi:hypothetical protein